ncbi:hypothetical protein T03_7450 [Trichinella britovi]|uniref:Uncharacterized protein n=1 Tax=Trichinella britovi TaxID=45882 RepID=A0A0V1BG00_TRIBR|nr:hypothetical protein T03_7450 [Trichinella britovi]
MTTRRGDRVSEEEPAKSDDGRTGADPEEAIQMTPPSGSLQRSLKCSIPPWEPRKFKINQSSTQNLKPIKIVQLPVVDEKPARPILLLQEDDREGFQLRSLVVGDPPWGPPHWLGVSGVNDVALHARPPEVQI